MNPFPVVWALFQRQRLTLLLFVILMAFSIALGVAVTAQERALRQGSARAADKFELLIGAPGSQYDLVLSAVYLRFSSMELLGGDVLAQILADPNVEWAAPIAFGDSADGYAVIGTTAQFVEYLSGGLAEGEMFADHEEALLGSEVKLSLGQRFRTLHGTPGLEEDVHEDEILPVGRMKPTGTPWDRAIILPIEEVWAAHGLPDGHGPAEAHEHHHDDEDGHDEAHADEDEHDHEHEHEDVQLGAPFAPQYLPGVPAVMVKAKDLPAAYGLRQAYKTERSQALFPAEVLVQLYALMGDARGVIQFLSLATQMLVVAAVLAGLLIVVQLHKSRLALLRALGAGRAYVLLVSWTYFTLLIGVAALAGLALGYAAAGALSAYLSSVSGFTIRPEMGGEEFMLVLGLLAAGAALALVPSLAVFRRPVVQDLAG